jgi:hypothetical protein
MAERCGRARETDSPSTSEHRGEGGRIFDEIGNLVEPTERPHMEIRAGPQRGRMPKRRGANSSTIGEQREE